jgi:hypothetical protein
MSFRISLPKPGALLRQPRQYGSADSLYFAQLKSVAQQSIVIVT